MGSGQRRSLALDALRRDRPLARLAREHAVSRKFLYAQAAKADTALHDAFDPPSDDDEVLFHLPVTKAWIKQLALALILICHSSYRGVQELLDALFDYRDLSLGSIHNLVRDAVEATRAVHEREDLSAVRVGAHDEIFQAGKPVLVGMDVETTYCYLLAAEAHRDETAWGAHLLDCEARGLRPDYTVADFGTGLRAGQKTAWPDTPCHGDVFHAERELGRLAAYLDNRACGAIAARDKLERKMTRARSRNRGQTLSKRLALARQAEEKVVALADDVRLLAAWIRDDILAAAGPCREERSVLYDFIVEELRSREALCSHRIAPVRRLLENQREALLAFTDIQDERFAGLAARLKVEPYLVHAVAELQGLDKNRPHYWQRRARLAHALGRRFHAVETEVKRIQAETPRASSMVENLNSRLRNYFFLRRSVGPEYLELLRFFLNHRRFLRSERPERVGKSPRELLSGEPHAHWLELLGYTRLGRD